MSKNPKARPNLPWLHDSQIDKVISYLKPSDIMLEWGAGGSTQHFSQFVKDYYSVEHIEKYACQKFPNNVIAHHVHPNYYPQKDPGVDGSDIPTNKYKEIKKELAKLNDRIDRKIIKGQPFQKDARRHRELLATLHRVCDEAPVAAARRARRVRQSPVHRRLAGGSMRRLFGIALV